MTSDLVFVLIYMPLKFLFHINRVLTKNFRNKTRGLMKTLLSFYLTSLKPSPNLLMHIPVHQNEPSLINSHFISQAILILGPNLKSDLGSQSPQGDRLNVAFCVFNSREE